MSTDDRRFRRKVRVEEPCDDLWMNKYWRPIMALAFTAIILFDFLIGPITWSIFQIIGAGTVSLQWAPLTLGGGGVFYGAMAVILGITAYTRGQEKIQRAKIPTFEEVVQTTEQVTPAPSNNQQLGSQQ